jgi:hypothetical protein
MLVGAHNGAVDHRIFVVGVCGEMPKHPLPHTAFGPTAEPQVDLYPVTKSLRQIAPWHSGTITVQHRLYEQPIVRRGHADRAFAPGQQILDPFPLIVAHSEPPHHRSVSNKLTAYESKKPPRRNRLRIPRQRLTAECGNRDSPSQYGVRVAPTDRNRLIDDRP